MVLGELFSRYYYVYIARVSCVYTRVVCLLYVGYALFNCVIHYGHAILLRVIYRYFCRRVYFVRLAVRLSGGYTLVLAGDVILCKPDKLN
jgi:hypothetical protein